MQNIKHVLINVKHTCTLKTFPMGKRANREYNNKEKGSEALRADRGFISRCIWQH